MLAQAKTVVTEALSFAAVLDFGVMACSYTGNDGSDANYLAELMLSDPDNEMSFVDSSTCGRPNNLAWNIRIENAGSFLASYEAILRMYSLSPRTALNAVGLRAALVAFGRECHAANTKWREEYELVPFATYLSRCAERAESLRDTLVDLSKSDPVTPLKAAIIRALSAESLPDGIRAEEQAATNEHFQDFFDVLRMAALTTERPACIIEPLKAFRERVLADRPYIRRSL